MSAGSPLMDALEVNDPEMLRLVDRDVRVEQVCTGFQFCEGPIWNPREEICISATCPVMSGVAGTTVKASSRLQSQ